MIALILFVVACLVLVSSSALWQRSLHKKRKVGLAALSALTLVLGGYIVILSGYAMWIAHRPLPANGTTTIFQGVTFTREVRSQPRPLIIDVISIDLNAPGIRFLVTPGQPTDGYELPSRTTSGFLHEFNLQIAINGDCCEPWWTYTPWNYYPHVGDGINVSGFASSEGKIYRTRNYDYPTLYISADNKASFGTPIGTVYNALSGLYMMLEDGKVAPDLKDPSHSELYTIDPRTVYALDKDATHLLLITVDGRQPGYSEGVTVAELSDIVLQYGAYTAMNVDGGGSTTLAMQGDDGWPILLNSPIDNEIPGRERPVGNHLGVYANRP